MSADGAQDTAAPHDQPPPRLPLSVTLIVRTAVEWAEDADLAALSMRRLGQVLGVEAMSLYRYVPSRDDLLDAMVEFIMDGVTAGEEAEWVESVETVELVEWEVYVSGLAARVRRVALQYPHTFSMVITRPRAAPWLRPPLHRLRWAEGLFSVLDANGFSDEAAVRAYRMLNSFLLGHLLIETAAPTAGTPQINTPSRQTPTGTADDTLAAYPHLARVRQRLVTDHGETDFEESLDHLIARISLTRT